MCIFVIRKGSHIHVEIVAATFAQLVNLLDTLLLESNTITSTQDVYVFISVINGALVLHSGNAGILRLCSAAYLNAARFFKTFFATNR